MNALELCTHGISITLGIRDIKKNIISPWSENNGSFRQYFESPNTNVLPNYTTTNAYKYESPIIYERQLTSISVKYKLKN